MSEPAELALPTAQALMAMMPDAFPVFFAGRKPWPTQALVMPDIVRGRSTLLAAPTASGKTEAAITPLYQRHVSFRRNRLSTLYIAPTKALANDIFERLDSYLGVRSPGCVTRYTGDRHDFGDAEGLFCLIVTPEALDSLQLVRPEALAGIRAVVVDEIHLLHGAPRGQQLRFVLDRVRGASDPSIHPRDAFQVVGMTATIDRLEEVRDLWLGPDGVLVRHGAPREISLELLDIEAGAQPGDDQAGKSARALAQWLRTSETPKVLVFDNTRNGAHALAAALDRELRVVFGNEKAPPLHLHLGVLSATERERVESAMKTDRGGVCVATSTLEIGIDIGDIDAVVLATPPGNVGSYLQRIGRGNRRSGLCRVLALYSGLDGAAMHHALLDCARRGELDDIHEYDRPSVRFQQVLSQAWLATRNEDELRPGRPPSPHWRTSSPRGAHGHDRHRRLDPKIAAWCSRTTNSSKRATRAAFIASCWAAAGCRYLTRARAISSRRSRTGARQVGECLSEGDSDNSVRPDKGPCIWKGPADSATAASHCCLRPADFAVSVGLWFGRWRAAMASTPGCGFGVVVAGRHTAAVHSTAC